MLTIIISLLTMLFTNIVSKTADAMKQVAQGIYDQYTSDAYVAWYQRHAMGDMPVDQRKTKRAYKKALERLEKKAERIVRQKEEEYATRLLGGKGTDASKAKELLRLVHPYYSKHQMARIPNEMLNTAIIAVQYLNNGKNYDNPEVGCMALWVIMGLADFGDITTNANGKKIIINNEVINNITDDQLKAMVIKAIGSGYTVKQYNALATGKKIAMWNRMLTALRGHVRYIQGDVQVSKTCTNILSMSEKPFTKWVKGDDGKWVPEMSYVTVGTHKYHSIKMDKIVKRSEVQSIVEETGYTPYFIEDSSASSVLVRAIFAINPKAKIVTISPEYKGDSTALIINDILDDGFIDEATGSYYRFLAMPAGKMKTCQYVFVEIPANWMGNSCAYIGYVWGKAMGFPSYAKTFMEDLLNGNVLQMEDVIERLYATEFKGYCLLPKEKVNVAKTWSRFGLSMSSTFSLKELAKQNTAFASAYTFIKNAKEYRVKDASYTVEAGKGQSFYVIDGKFDIHAPLDKEGMESRIESTVDSIIERIEKDEFLKSVSKKVVKLVNDSKKVFRADATKAEEALVKANMLIHGEVTKQEDILENSFEGDDSARKKIKEFLAQTRYTSDMIKEVACNIHYGIKSELIKKFTPGDGEMLANVIIIAAINVLLRKITIDEFFEILIWWDNSDRILANCVIKDKNGTMRDENVYRIVKKMRISFTIRHGGKKGLLKLADFGQMTTAVKDKEGNVFIDTYSIITPDSAEKFSAETWDSAEFAVCLVSKNHSAHDTIFTNAFMWSALKIAPKDAIKIVKDILDEMSDAIKDPEKAVAFFGRYGSEFDETNGPVKLLAMNSAVLKMDIVQLALRTSISHIISMMCCGRANIPGNTSFIGCDWAALMNMWLKEEFDAANVHIKTLDDYAKEQNVNGYKVQYSNRTGKAIIARSPGYGWQEIVKVNLVSIEEWWWNHDVVELSVEDAVWENLQGADFDGDKVHLVFDDNDIGRIFVNGVRHGDVLIGNEKHVLLPVYLNEPGIIQEMKQPEKFTWQAIKSMLMRTLNGDEVGTLSKAAMCAIDISNEMELLAQMNELTGMPVYFYDKWSRDYGYVLGMKITHMFASDRFDSNTSEGEVPMGEDGKPIDPRLSINGTMVKNELTDAEKKALGNLFDVDGNERLYTGWRIVKMHGVRTIVVEAPVLGFKTKIGEKTITVKKGKKTKEQKVDVYEYGHKTWTLGRDVEIKAGGDINGRVKAIESIKGKTMLFDTEVFNGYKTAEQLREAATEFAKLGIINGCECGREIDRTKNGFGHIWGILMSCVPAHRVYSDWAKKGQANETLIRNQHISTSTLGVLYQYVQMREKEIDKSFPKASRMLPFIANLLTQEEYDGVFKLLSVEGNVNGNARIALEYIKSEYNAEVKVINVKDNPELLEFAKAKAIQKVATLCYEKNVPIASAAVVIFFLTYENQKSVSSFTWLFADEFAEILKRDINSRRIIKLNHDNITKLVVEKDKWLVATTKNNKGKTRQVLIEKMEDIATGEIDTDSIFTVGGKSYVAAKWEKSVDETLVTAQTYGEVNVIDGPQKTISLINKFQANNNVAMFYGYIDTDTGLPVALFKFSDSSVEVAQIGLYRTCAHDKYMGIRDDMQIATLLGKPLMCAYTDKTRVAEKSGNMSHLQIMSLSK